MNINQNLNSIMQLRNPQMIEIHPALQNNNQIQTIGIQTSQIAQSCLINSKSNIAENCLTNYAIATNNINSGNALPCVITVKKGANNFIRVSGKMPVTLAHLETDENNMLLELKSTLKLLDKPNSAILEKLSTEEIDTLRTFINISIEQFENVSNNAKSEEEIFELVFKNINRHQIFKISEKLESISYTESGKNSIKRTPMYNKGGKKDGTYMERWYYHYNNMTWMVYASGSENDSPNYLAGCMIIAAIRACWK